MKLLMLFCLWWPMEKGSKVIFDSSSSSSSGTASRWLGRVNQRRLSWILNRSKPAFELFGCSSAFSPSKWFGPMPLIEERQPTACGTLSVSFRDCRKPEKQPISTGGKRVDCWKDCFMVWLVSTIQSGLLTLPFYGWKLGLYGNDLIDVKMS